MSFDMRRLTRLALVAGAAMSIAACASHPKPEPAPAPAPQPPPAQTPYTPPPAPVAEQPTGPIPGSVQDFVINAGDRVYFDTDKFDIRADADPILAQQAAWLSRYPQVKVRVEGNADERGTREYNFALGSRRANSIRDYLVAHGVAAGRIETVSYGKERPVDPGTGEDAWQHNRNGHTTITDGAR
ncbi:MAG: peptidoglycan-associated lipoprotein Pal [Caulobacteraceae bacterium]|nr:peptidoglycan-associated lipoprotein Pal [Caulobacteraceae bacterium]